MTSKAYSQTISSVWITSEELCPVTCSHYGTIRGVLTGNGSLFFLVMLCPSTWWPYHSHVLPKLFQDSSKAILEPVVSSPPSHCRRCCLFFLQARLVIHTLHSWDCGAILCEITVVSGFWFSLCVWIPWCSGSGGNPGTAITALFCV